MSHQPLNPETIKHVVEKLDGEISHPYWQTARAAALRSPDLWLQLVKAERFIAGFEGDHNQDGIDELLAGIRKAIGKGGDQ